MSIKKYFICKNNVRKQKFFDCKNFNTLNNLTENNSLGNEENPLSNLAH